MIYHVVVCVDSLPPIHICFIIRICLPSELLGYLPTRQLALKKNKKRLAWGPPVLSIERDSTSFMP